MIELSYKQVVDGVKITADDFKAIYDMMTMIYQTLAPQGSMTPEQLRIYDEARRIVDSM